TDALGAYLFDSLTTGNYRVQFVSPAGTIASKQNLGGDDTKDSDINSQGLSQLIAIDTSKPTSDTLRNNPRVDAGFVPVGSIGDYVFSDKDFSGTQTSGDTPISGIKVYLLDAATGTKLDSTITNVNGLYKFDSLLSGNYKVQFVLPNGSTIVPKDSGGNDALDSDPDPLTGITDSITLDTSKPLNDPTRTITTVDAGVVPTTVDLSIKKIAVGNCKRNIGDNITFKVVVKREDINFVDVTTTIKDSLSTNLQFVSATASEGTYSNATKLWSGITLAKGDSATLEITAKIVNSGGFYGGLVCNEAWVQTMSANDSDSQAGNKIESEDDYDRACVSVPLKLCKQRSEKVELTAPTGTVYQWYKDGSPIAGATNSTYLATEAGEYTVTVDGNACTSSSCCPIYIEDFCDCPPQVCVPIAIQRSKTGPR
nr:hypothetical protein [Spirosomataceae bacterium]